MDNYKEEVNTEAGGMPSTNLVRGERLEAGEELKVRNNKENTGFPFSRE